MGLIVYSANETRGSIAEWFVKELDIPHEVKLLNYKEKEHREPWFLKLNPFHRLPTIQDGDFVLYESGAILIYLQNKYAGPISEKELGLLSQWILFANATLGDAMHSKENLETLLTELDPVLEGVDFLVGDRFTAADVALTSYVLYIPMMVPEIKISSFPNLQRYTAAIGSRDACPYKDWIPKEEEK